jgi:glycosyltransferase involved in cell wall biosynthesis
VVPGPEAERAGAPVFFSNNYSTALAERRCAAGTYPRQHLYGLQHLRAAGFDVHVREPGPWRGLTWLSSRARGRLGDLHQLPRALARGRADSVDVAAEPWHVAALAQLRAKRWRRQPLVAVMHAPIRVSAFSRRMVEGFDVVLCLSAELREHLLHDFGRDERTTLWAPWGPDLAFSGYRSTGEKHVVSTGKTLRDPETLMAALEGTAIPARVYGAARSSGRAEAVRATAHSDLGRGSTPQFSYEQVLPDLQSAAVVAVPLASDDRLAGLSEVVDALALGKPLVVTRSRWLDVDVEKIGCGIAVDPGDVAGWRDALHQLWHDPELRRAMGRAGRGFAERELNADAFGTVLVDAVHQVRRP